MDKVIDSSENSSTVFERPTLLDVGIGVLYFFTSHMVIRAMYYIGVDRTPAEITAFFFTVVVSAIFAHLLAKPLLRLRLFIEATLGFPVVSVVAAVGATLALFSMLPVVHISLFYVSGALLGLACGWIVVIWISTIRVNRPDAKSFHLQPARMVAVLSYFLFRLVSSFSDTVTQGFLLALPLVTIVCIIRSEKGVKKGEKKSRGEGSQSLQTLVVVAAVFAIACSVAVYLSGREGDMLASGLNYMVLFEVLAVALIVFCCWCMDRFTRRATVVSVRLVATLTPAACFVPLFFIGTIMGGAGIPQHSPEALWESNIWVLIIAIFAYDIRDSLFAVKGLAVGLMFEAMCMGQLIVRASSSQFSAYSLALAACLTVGYFACVCWQFLHASPSKERNAVEGGGKGALSTSFGESGLAATTELGSFSHEEAVPSLMSAPLDELLDEGAVPSEIAVYCHKLALDYGLTRREAEILALIAMGRSAKYIAEELTISHNTTRTHVKHIYEKLNIHSKQELIDLVMFGSA